MKLRELPYNVPTSLEREKEAVIMTCNMIIDAFRQQCVNETNRLQAENIAKMQARVFVYTIKDIDDGWRILHKETTPETSVKEDRDASWSIPFKIINGVLFYRDRAHNAIQHMKATACIPQGLFDETTLEQVNTNW